MLRTATEVDAKPLLRGLRRHWLVWVAQELHARLALQVDDATVRAHAAQFLAAGWPLVVCGQPCGTGDRKTHPASLAAGMPLPPHQGKCRLRFLLPRESVVRVAPPLLLAEAIPALPPRWQGPLRGLMERAQAIDIELRLFGSAAWAALTGTRYLTPGSDVDLLWQPPAATHVDSGIAMLTDWEARSGLTADGEILFGDDAAVSWREWRQVRQYGDTTQVLVKSLRGPQLCLPSELLARLPHRVRPPAQLQCA